MCNQKPPVILHISDLHFGWDGDSEQALMYRKVSLEQNFIRAVRNLDPEWRPSLICITGDLAGKGRESDYAQAGKWLDDLLSALKIPKSSVVICPGNHDVDRSISFPCTRPGKHIKADTALAVPIDDGFTGRFHAFVDWCHKWGLSPLDFHGSENYLVGSRTIMDVRFVILNSAWFSRDNRDDGSLWLGWPHIICMESDSCLPNPEDLESSPITIAIFHHPPSALNADETEPARDQMRPSTYDYLCNRCHIILTGHTHRKARSPSLPNAKAVHIEAGATYESRAYYNNVGLLQLRDNDVVYRRLQFDPSSDENGWEAKLAGKPIQLYRKSSPLIKETQEVISTAYISGMVADVRGEAPQEEAEPAVGKDPVAVPRFQRPAITRETVGTVPRVSAMKESVTTEEYAVPNANPEAVRSRIERDLFAAKKLSLNREFAAAAEVADSLNMYLTEVGERIPTRAAEVYHELLRLELECVRQTRGSDHAKAVYYLSKAQSYQEKARNAG